MLINWGTLVCIIKIVKFTLNQICKPAGMMVGELGNLSNQHQIVKIDNKGRIWSYNYKILWLKNLNYIVSI